MIPRLCLWLPLLAASLAGPCMAQSNLVEGDVSGPHAAMERFLALNAAGSLAGAEGQALLAGELAGSTRPSLGPLPPPDRIVLLSGGRAVARLPGEGETRPDFYVFLRAEQGVWRLTGGRSLALTGLLGELRDALRQINSRTDEQEHTLGNVELTLATDATLRRWFDTHRAEMESLRAIAGRVDGRIETPEANALVARLRLGSVGSSADGVVRASIGGLVDNEVGFLHAADPATVPEIDPSGHIWIEPLGGGWYLFKTT